MAENKNAVLIVAEEPVAARAGALLDAHYHVDLLEAPESVERLLEAVVAIAPDIVVIDSDLPEFEWVSAVHAIPRQEPRPQVLVLGRDSQEAVLLAAFREGAGGCLPKASLSENLLPAVQTLTRGCVYFRRGDAEVIREHMRYLELGEARNVANVQNGITKLTVREKEVFPLLADGVSIKETGRTLGISPKTVETHKYHIMKKLGFDSMADFTKLAMIKDLIPL